MSIFRWYWLGMLLLALVGCTFAGGIHTRRIDAKAIRTQVGGERIYVINARVNGQPVLLNMDTGASFTVLYYPTARRLGLKVTWPQMGKPTRPGLIRVGYTEPCTFTLGSWRYDGPLPVVNVPAATAPGMNWDDGVVGWSNMRHHLLYLQIAQQRITCLDKLPANIASWQKFDLVEDTDVLAFKTSADKDAPVILIDTGSRDGVKLSPLTWRRWRAAHSELPATLVVVGTLYDQPQVREQCWATRWALGNFALDNVPVRQTHAYTTIKNCQAELGVFALDRLEVITDWPHGCVYIRPSAGPRHGYNYNRLGAVFIADSDQNDDLVAHVVPGTPAADADIRDGDVLLQIGALDATKWRTDPRLYFLGNYWAQPASTRLPLTLRRGEKTYRVTVTLRDILGVDKP